jgi:uncharacterized repeat protein (TIGR01451 family)
MPLSLINECGNLPPFVSLTDCQNLFQSGNLLTVQIVSDTFDDVDQVEHPAVRNFLMYCDPGPCSNANVTITHDPATTCLRDCGNSTATLRIEYDNGNANFLGGLLFAGELSPTDDPDPNNSPPNGWGTGCGPMNGDCGASNTPGASMQMSLIEINDANPAGSQNRSLLTGTLEEGHDSDLAVTKTDSPDPVTAGNLLTYIVTVENLGPDTATRVLLTDTLDSNTTFVSATPDQGTCSETPPGVVTCELGFMAPGDVVNVTIVVLVDESTPGGTVLTNTAVIGGNIIDDDPTNNTATEDTTVLASTTPIDLSVMKDDDPDPIIAGSSTDLTYTITVDSDNDDATGVIVTDTLPAGVTYDDTATDAANSGDICDETAPGSGIVICTLGDLDAGDFPVTVDIVVNVDPSTRATITNTVTVSSNETDSNTSNNTDTEDTDIETEADLGITKSDNPDPVIYGNALTYILDVTNNGPSDATSVTVVDTSVTVVDTLPSGVTFISATIAGQGTGCTFEETGTIDGVADGDDNVNCDVGTIAAGAPPVTITIVVTAPALPGNGCVGTIITNTATVSATEPDATSSNDDTTEDTTVNCPPAETADVSVEKFDDPDPVLAGNTLVYRIVVTNYDGSNAATNVTITDSLPAGVTYDDAATDAANSGDICDETAPGSGIVTCTIGNISAGGNSGDIFIVVTVDPSVPDGTTITNDVLVSSSNDDNPANNEATEDTLVNAEADLEITKSDNPDPIPAGTLLTYTFTVTNLGPSDASGIVVTDTLPPGVTYVDEASSDRCDETASGVITCDASDLVAGQSRSFSITVFVELFTKGTIINRAVVSGDQTDPEGDNNSDTESTTVLRSIPTLSQWGVVIFILLLGGIGVLWLRRQRYGKTG